MMRVVVVDDETSLLEITKRFLESGEDIRVSTASTAREALDTPDLHAYDAIVSDYRMSDMDGLQLLQAIRERDQDIPFILFTGHGREEIAMQALNRGADFYLQKGGDPSTQFAELRNMINMSVQKRRAADKLRQSEEAYRHVLESSPALICRLSPEGRTIFVSGIVGEYTKYTPSDLKDRNWWDLFYPEDLRPQVDKLYADYFDKGLDVRNFEMHLRDRDGGQHTLLWNSSNKWDEATGKLLEINGAALDATRRVKVQESLRRSEEFNRVVLNSIDANIAVLDGRGDIVTTNDSWKRFREANGGQPPREGVRRNYLKVCEQAAKDGVAEAGEVLDGLKQVLAGKINGFSLEYPCHSPDRKRWFLVDVSPLSHGAEGAVVAHIDITARKQTEDALVQTNRKLNLLSGITRHDIVNQLMVLQANLETALVNAGSGRSVDSLGRAMDAVGYVLRCLEFSREYQALGERSPEWINAQTLCEEAASQARADGVSVNVTLRGLELFADPMLEKVFHNLLANAVRHGEKVTTVDIWWEPRGERIAVLCEDDGIGVPWTRKEQIFERGCSTSGGGFGLYLAKEVLSITDISISETGVPGQGARFEIVVPSGAFRTETHPSDMTAAGEPRQRTTHAISSKGDVS